MKTQKDFERRSSDDQEYYLKNTWCVKCKKADLGMTDPVEFNEDGISFVEGKCVLCGSKVISEISEMRGR
jgi:hypothetical protein